MNNQIFCTNCGKVGHKYKSCPMPITSYGIITMNIKDCLLYTSPSPRDRTRSRMPSSA